MNNQQLAGLVVAITVIGILGFTTGLSINLARDSGDSGGNTPATQPQKNQNNELTNLTNELSNMTASLERLESELEEMNSTIASLNSDIALSNISSQISDITNELAGINQTLALSLNQTQNNETELALKELATGLELLASSIENLSEEPNEISEYGNVSFSGVAFFKYIVDATPHYPEDYGYINITKNGTMLTFNFTDIWKLQGNPTNTWNATVRAGIDRYWTWVCYQDGILTDSFNFGLYLGITNGTTGSSESDLANDNLVVTWEVSKVPTQIGFYDSEGRFYLRSF